MIALILLFQFAYLTNGQTQSSFHTICTTLVDENVDPIVLPGKVGYGHGHRVVGANGFNSKSTPISQNSDPATDIFQTSTGTTCDIAKDLSVYWQPILYYQLSSNNNLIRVKDGTALQYYNFYPGTQNFPDMFKVVVGTPTRTKDSGLPDNPAVYFEYPVGTKIYDFPQVSCTNKMLRAHVFFPNCGKVDPVTNKLMTDPITGRYVLEYPTGFRSGAEVPHVPAFDYRGKGCPAGDLVFPQLHQAFHYDLSNICPNGNLLPGRFVWANGNTDGRGLHADFLNGWDQTLMNSVINQCLAGNCISNGNGCPTNICQKTPPPSYTLKEGSFDYNGPSDGSGIPPSVYLQSYGTKPNWGFIDSSIPLPTSVPTTKIAALPTSVPTMKVSVKPTSFPTNMPNTVKPTNRPSRKPTSVPTNMPSTVKPTNRPSVKPTLGPTNMPSVKPTSVPTNMPI